MLLCLVWFTLGFEDSISHVALAALEFVVITKLPQTHRELPTSTSKPRLNVFFIATLKYDHTAKVVVNEYSDYHSVT